jgi:FkbM family methyltransferase
VKRAVHQVLLAAYRIVFARGLLRYAWGRRAFYRAYEVYKAAFEAGPIDRLRAYAPEGALIIDVGANIGFFTERFARWVGEAGRVIAIEPEAVNFAELGRRMARKGLAARIDARLAAADAAPGTVHLVLNPDHPGDHKLGSSGRPVDAVTLDDLVPADRPVALIKIDVQGAELRVLAGATRILERDHPALFIEVDPVGLMQFGGSVDALLHTLEAQGYRPHRLTRSGAVPCPPTELDRVLARRGYTDMLFLARPAP